MHSKRLQRLLKRHLGDPDAETKFAAIAQRLKDSPELAEDDRIAVETLLTQLPDFLTSIDESYEQFEEQSKMAVRNLDISSAELNEVNEKQERLHAALKAMMDGLGQGLLFFNREGICSPTFSAACQHLLECRPGGMHFADVLRLSPQERDLFTRFVTMLFKGGIALSFQELAELAPTSYNHGGGRHVELTYRPLYSHSRALEHVLVIATDKTAEFEAQEKLKRREELARRTLRIARNRNMFMRMTVQMRELLNEWDDYIRRPKSLLNMVHTLKSAVAVFQLNELSALLHQLEDLLHKDTTHKTLSAVKLLIAKQFAFDLIEAGEILGDDFEQKGSVYSVAINDINQFLGLLKKKFGTQASEINRLFLAHIVARPVHGLLEDFDIQIQEIAERCGKQIVPCQFEGENFPILQQCYSSLFDTLVHIARNIIDHGIEEPRLRQQLGKPASGTVRITTRKLDDAKFEIIITDDGSGILVERCRTRLLERMARKAVDAMTDEAVMQYIFTPAFSTRDRVTEISGRGVGLNAVKEEAEKIGGTIRVESKAGEYTRFILQLPFLWDIA